MTANVWNPNPSFLSQSNGSALIKTEVQYPTIAQRSFTLLTFAYATGTGSLFIVKNGQFLIRNIDYFEIDSTTVLFNIPCAVTDTILFVGFVGIAATVTVDAQLRTDLASTTGAANISYQLPGGIKRTLLAKLKDAVSVKDFGAVGDGVTNDTVAFQAALDSGYKTIYVPDGTYLVDSLIDRIRTSIIGESKRSAVIKQSGTTGILIVLEPGIPNTPYVIADITEGGQVFSNIGLYVTGSCGIKAINGFSSTVVIDNVRVIHHDADVTPYNPTNGTIGIDMENGTQSAFLPIVRDTEVRSFDTGIKMGAVVNDFMIIGGWLLNCRYGVRVCGNSVGVISTAVETNVLGAYGLYFIGAASNNITLNTIRFELTGTGGCAIAFDATATGSYGIYNQNPYYLLGSGTTPTLGTIPSSYLEITLNSGTDPAISSGTKILQVPPIVKPYTSGAAQNTIYRFYRSDGVLVGEAGWTTASDILYFNNKNGGTIKHQINGADAFNINALGVTPGSDNTQVLGGATARFTTVYAATATINTSDERHKIKIQDIEPAALRAWSKVKFKQFKYTDAVELKGDAARIHFGVIAQEVKAAFESEGLDPFAYGILCYDEWEDIYKEVLDEEGNPTGEKILVKLAGNIYGVRYDEAFALTLALLLSK